MISLVFFLFFIKRRRAAVACSGPSVRPFAGGARFFRLSCVRGYFHAWLSLALTGGCQHAGGGRGRPELVTPSLRAGATRSGEPTAEPRVPPPRRFLVAATAPFLLRFSSLFLALSLCPVPASAPFPVFASHPVTTLFVCARPLWRGKRARTG